MHNMNVYKCTCAQSQKKRIILIIYKQSNLFIPLPFFPKKRLDVTNKYCSFCFLSYDLEYIYKQLFHGMCGHKVIY